MGDDDSGEDKNFSYVIELKKSNFIVSNDPETGEEILEVGARWTLGISVKDCETLPANFQLAIIYIGKSKEVPPKVYKTMKVSETLTKYPDSETLPTSLKMDETSVAVYNETDRFYHLGTVDGPVIVAKIALPCEYIDKSFASIEDSGNRALTLENEYNYTDFIKRYAEVCNNHGVYGVTEELKLFLDRFQHTHNYFGNSGWVSGQIDYTAAPENYWMFAAYVY